MRSNSYELQLGNFNMTSGEKSSGSYTVTDTVGQTAAGQFNSSGYNVYAGFQYLYTLSQFSFAINDLSIDLGELTPTTFASATNTLTITTSNGGYTIFAYADHPLRVVGGSTTIPFTTCGGSCSISTAALWTDTAQKGFGFNVAGTNKSTDFVNTNYFRPFADYEASQQSQEIASANSVVTDDTLTVTYKGVIAEDQAGGSYETAVTYVAVPGY